MNFITDVWFTVATGLSYADTTGFKLYWNHPTFIELFEYQRSIADTYGGNELLGEAIYDFVFFKMLL